MPGEIMAEETTNESCNAPIKKRISRKRPATELTPGTPAATEHIAPEPDAATEHIAPASLGSTCEASPGSGDMIIASLADVVSKLAHEREESAVALCSAARTLQRGREVEKDRGKEIGLLYLASPGKSESVAPSMDSEGRWFESCKP